MDRWDEREKMFDGDTPEEIMDILYSRLGRKPSKSEIKELIESGFSIKKSGGPIVKRKTGRKRE